MVYRACMIGVVTVLTVVTLTAQSSSPPTPPQPSQPPPATFRAEVNYVEVDARVVDREDRFVADLSSDDFQVFEDGKPQQVTIFSMVNLPVATRQPAPASGTPTEPDVFTNLGALDGRTYLIVLDDLHIAPQNTPRVRAAARQFVERYLGANDMAAVFHTSGRKNAGQEFTANPRLLLNAVDKFMGRKLRSETLSRIDGLSGDDPSGMERGFNARNTLDALKSITDFLAGVRGRRKAVVFFSEGIDYDIDDAVNPTDAHRDATTIIDITRAVIAAATRANVAIYGIDPRGLTVDGGIGIEMGSYPTAGGINSGSIQSELRRGQDSLRVLSDGTGGFASVNSNDLNRAFERLVNDNSAYYVLGYYPTNDKRDGRFRTIDVRVSRPGVSVRARKGYSAPRGKVKADDDDDDSAPAELRAAMSSPLPVSDLPLSATAVAFKGSGPNAAVVVSTLIGAGDMALTAKDSTFHNDLQIAVVAVDQAGKIFNGVRDSVTLKLKPETVPRLRAAGFRLISQIDLPPGRYQLRIVASEGNGRRAGSILCDLDVPSFTGRSLAMSGLALSSASSGMAPTVRFKDPLAKLLPGPLTTDRDFATSDEIAMFAEIYAAAGSAASTIDLAATLTDDDGQAVFESREELAGAAVTSNGGRYQLARRIPLQDIRPGRYLLRVEAQSRSGGRAQIARETVIRVVAPPAR